MRTGIFPGPVILTCLKRTGPLSERSLYVPDWQMIGNLPWASYTDLPETYRTFVRKKFVRTGLADDPRQLFLG